jgi:hypothetical protein
VFSYQSDQYATPEKRAKMNEKNELYINYAGSAHQKQLEEISKGAKSKREGGRHVKKA